MKRWHYNHDNANKYIEKFKYDYEGTNSTHLGENFEDFISRSRGGCRLRILRFRPVIKKIQSSNNVVKKSEWWLNNQSNDSDKISTVDS